MSRCTRLLIAAAVGLFCACDGHQQSSSPPGVVDDTSINDVWYKAKLRTVSFRAIGQEPAWLLEITNGTEILIVTNYGETRSSFSYFEPVVHQEQRRTVFVLSADSSVVEILGEPCQDIMSGEQFPTSVTIRLSDTTLQGCGRALLQK